MHSSGFFRIQAYWKVDFEVRISRKRGVRHELESRTTCLESLGIPHKIRNLALESGIFSQINIRKFPIISGYFNSARLTLLLGGTFCHTRDRVTNGKKLSRAVAIVRGVLSRI